MTVDAKKSRGSKGPLASLTQGIGRYIFTLLGLAVLDGLGLWLLYMLIRDGAWPVATPIAVILILVNVLNLSPKLFPIRWQIPAGAIV